MPDNKQEYLKNATGKIYSYEQKQEVKTELESHIDDKTDYYTDIGYDSNKAQEKACNDMGDAELIADSLGMLHSTDSRLWIDFLISGIITGLHIIMYYVLNKYAFNDSGLISLLLSGILLSLGAVYLFSTITARSTALTAKLLNLPVICISAYFCYTTMCALAKRCGGSINALFMFIKAHDIPSLTDRADNDRIILITFALLFTGLISFTVMLFYCIKVKALSNRLIDNRISRFFHGLTKHLALIILTLGIVCAVKSYFDVTALRQEYLDAYMAVLQMSKNCNTEDDLIQYAKDSSYDFIEIHNSSGELSELSYSHNMVNIRISLPASQSESKTELLSYSSIFLQCDYTDFGKSYDSATLNFIFLDNEEEARFRSIVPDEENLSELTDFYASFVPLNLKVNFSVNDYNNCTYDFQFVCGRDIHKHIIRRTSINGTEKYESYYAFTGKIADIIKNEPDITLDELAEITGAEQLEYVLDRDEFNNSMYNNEYYATMEIMNEERGYTWMTSAYDIYVEAFYSMLKEQIEKRPLLYRDGVYFEIIDTENGKIAVFLNTNHFITSEINSVVIYNAYSEEAASYSNYNAYDVIKSVSSLGGFFDREGYYYDTAEEIAYYAESGEKYYFYRRTIEDKTHTVGNTFEYYLTDRNKKYIKADICYIDENGYIVFDNAGVFSYDENSEAYTDPSGKVYHRATETSWNSKGEQIFQSDKTDIVLTELS